MARFRAPKLLLSWPTMALLSTDTTKHHTSHQTTQIELVNQSNTIGTGGLGIANR